jgi:hypothetical protein
MQALASGVRFPAGRFVLFGSAPLLVRWIVPATGDVDVLVRGPAWDDARRIGLTASLQSYDVEVVLLLEGRIEIDIVRGDRRRRRGSAHRHRRADREHPRLIAEWESRPRA